MTLVSAASVGVEYGATTILRDVSFTVARGERWGILGRNGSGKTSLLRLLTGEQAPTRGQIVRQPGAQMSLLEQHRDYGDARTVWEGVAGALGDLFELERSLARRAHEIADATDATRDKLMTTYAHELEAFERAGGYTLESRVDAVLHGMGFDPADARERELATLSGGERGRVGLARQLLAPEAILLLDEPTNHLDLDTTEWLEHHLKETDKTVLLVSHDRAFLAAIVDHVLHLENGTAKSYVGTYTAFVQQRAEQRLTLQRQFDQQKRVVAAEEDYIRRNLAGQNTRQAKGRRKKLARLPRLSPPPGEKGSMSLRLTPQNRSGEQVVVADHATVSVEDRILVEDIEGIIRRGDVVALVGPNGTGKSTLLKAMLGERPPSEGRIRLGSNVDVGYMRQDLSQLPLDLTIAEVISTKRPTWDRGVLQGHLGRFGFSGDEVQRRVGSLSGGERARLAMAVLMLTNANFLALDEPTNHLDVETIEALEDALEEYEGTVLLVSHDRELLRGLATRVWAIEDGVIQQYEGGFDEWLEARVEQQKDAARAASDALAKRRETAKRRDDRQKKTAPDTSRDRARELRTTQRLVEQHELAITSLETRIAEITALLADGSLYHGVDGAMRAQELSTELKEARGALEDEMSSWAKATEALDRLSK